MRYIVTLFWSFVLGQVVGYIGGALTSGGYDFTLTTIISLVAGVVVILLGALELLEKKPHHIHKSQMRVGRSLILFMYFDNIISLSINFLEWKS